MASAQLTPFPGKYFRGSTATTEAGTYTLVKGMTGYDSTGNVQVNNTATFDADVAFSDVGAEERTYSFNGLLIPADPGQLAIRAAAASKATIWFKFLPMGGSTDVAENTLGWTNAVKVGSRRHGQQAAPGAATWGFDLASQADPVITTGGYII